MTNLTKIKAVSFLTDKTLAFSRIEESFCRRYSRLVTLFLFFVDAINYTKYHIVIMASRP